MKARILFPILIVISLILGVISAINPSASQGEFVTTSTLNIRSGPGTEYSKIGVMPSGTVLDTIDYSDGWYKINFNNSVAYVSGSHVSNINSIPVTQTENAVVTSTNGEDKALALAIFGKVNAYRISIGISPLVWDDKLYPVAQTRAVEISTNWSHVRPNGLYPDSAFVEKGVKFKLASENLLRYVTNEEDSFNTWYNSSSHRATMENSSLKKSAIYVYKAPDGYLYVAQEFTD